MVLGLARACASALARHRSRARRRTSSGRSPPARRSRWSPRHERGLGDLGLARVDAERVPDRAPPRASRDHRHGPGRAPCRPARDRRRGGSTRRRHRGCRRRRRPAARRARPRPRARGNAPPSLNESGVTFTMPMTASFAARAERRGHGIARQGRPPARPRGPTGAGGRGIGAASDHACRCDS